MTAPGSKQALRAEPFRPFHVRIASGKSLDVANPDLIVVSSTGRTAITDHPGSDAFDVIDLPLVESLKFPDNGEAGAKGANGAPKW